MERRAVQAQMLETITELRTELTRLEKAYAILSGGDVQLRRDITDAEIVASIVGPKRRGRPPKNMVERNDAALAIEAKHRASNKSMGTRKLSPDAQAKIKLGQEKRWHPERFNKDGSRKVVAAKKTAKKATPKPAVKKAPAKAPAKKAATKPKPAKKAPAKKAKPAPKPKSKPAPATGPYVPSPIMRPKGPVRISVGAPTDSSVVPTLE